MSGHPQELAYDYELQCWTRGGVIVGCGHTEQKADCTACNWTGHIAADVRKISTVAA